MADIDEIRTGFKTKSFNKSKYATPQEESHALSIVYGSRSKDKSTGVSNKTVDVLCFTEADRDMWASALSTLNDLRFDPGISFVKKTYRKLKKPYLSIHDATRLLYKINFKVHFFII